MIPEKNLRNATLGFAVLFVPGMMALAFVLAGCSPLEVSARDAAAAAQGFLEQAQQNHLAECQANPGKPFPCVTINQAVGAQNLLIDAIEQYCGWPSRPGADALKQFAGQPCARNKGAEQHLQNAVASLNSIIADYKLAAGNAK